MDTISHIPDHDPVSAPIHYYGARFQAVDIIELYGLSACWHIGTAMKYLIRAGKKGEAAECISKACWYLDRWLSDPYGTATFAAPNEDEETPLPTPAEVVADFGLTGNVAIAVTYVLQWAVDGDGESEIEKALSALRVGDVA